MQDPGVPVARTGMVAIIGATETQAGEVGEKAAGGEVLVPANYNAPGQIVISGTGAACNRAVEIAGRMGLRPARLSVAGAFHSPLMAPAAERLAAALDGANVPLFLLYATADRLAFFGIWSALWAASLQRYVVAVPTASVIAVRGGSELLRTVSNPLSDAAFFLGLVRLAGGHNVFGDAAAKYPRPNPEEVIARDPEVIVICRLTDTGEEADAARKFWQRFTKLKAVKAGRLHVVPGDWLTKPGFALGRGIEELRRIL